MIIVENGHGQPGANSYQTLDDLQFHGRYYRCPIPDTEAEQAEYLLRACAQMELMRWQGVPTHRWQPLAWPREGIILENHVVMSKTLIPYGIRHGQVMLAIELYCRDQGIELIEPTHCYPKGEMPRALQRSDERFQTDTPLWVASWVQFSPYLVRRGLSLVR